MKEDLIKIFANNLRYYRLEYNMTQSELAKKSNLTSKFISDLERASYKPSLDTISILAEVLGVKPYILLKPNDVRLEYTRLDKKTGRRKPKTK